MKYGERRGGDQGKYSGVKDIGGLVVRRSGGCERGSYGGVEQWTSSPVSWRRSKRAMNEGQEVRQGLVKRASG